MLELKEFASKIRGIVKPIYDEIQHRVTAEICEQIIDSRVLDNLHNQVEIEEKRYGKAARMGSPLSIAHWSIYERQKQIKISNLRDPLVDFSFNLIVIPIKGKVLAIYYTEQNEYIEALMYMGEVSEYGYWNDSDKPAELTEEEWQTRREDWDIALPGIGIPADNGFDIQLITDTCMYPNIEKVVGYVKPLSDRIKYHAKRCLINDYLKKSEEASKVNSLPLEGIEKAIEHTKTPEGAEELALWSKVIATMLEEITEDTLLGKLKK